jgi:adenylosuccinate lyase
MTPGARRESPLELRYASPAMQALWSGQHRAGLWRRLWLALAEAERDLGVAIPEAALTELRAHLDDADLDAVRAHERRLRHDVMAHIHHLGDQAPAARAYVHLGATSCFVTDNADLIVLRDACRLLLGRLRDVLRALRGFAATHADVPTLAYTHYQPAQLTTVGKRATLWALDFALDAEALLRLVRTLPFRGCKGTTGTQASFLELLGGDAARVRELDRRVTAAFGFDQAVPVSGQTYTRKLDAQVFDVWAGLGQSAAKFGNDLRLLQHEGEVLEPAESAQVGSSAMPYKRNPMRAERMVSLSRYLIALRENTAYTAATQWLERTLDDSANRRMVLPDGALAADAILLLAADLARGLDVREPTVRRHVALAMPYMATERWLMLGVTAGGDRQVLHEVIRKHSWAARDAEDRGEPGRLLERLAADPALAALDAATLRRELDPARYVGRAPDQVREYLTEHLDPLLSRLEPFAVQDAAGVTI